MTRVAVLRMWILNTVQYFCNRFQATWMSAMNAAIGLRASYSLRMHQALLRSNSDSIRTDSIPWPKHRPNCSEPIEKKKRKPSEMSFPIELQDVKKENR